MNKIVICILVVWFGLALFRLVNNTVRLSLNIPQIFVSDNVKRMDLFGIDQILVNKFQEKNSVHTVLLLNSKGTISFHYLRYLLYPIKFYENNTLTTYDAVVVFNTGQNVKKQIANIKTAYPKVERINHEGKLKAFLFTK